MENPKIYKIKHSDIPPSEYYAVQFKDKMKIKDTHNVWDNFRDRYTAITNLEVHFDLVVDYSVAKGKIEVLYNGCQQRNIFYDNTYKRIIGGKTVYAGDILQIIDSDGKTIPIIEGGIVAIPFNATKSNNNSLSVECQEAIFKVNKLGCYKVSVKNGQFVMEFKDEA
jgi:hypothetical protein